MKKLLIIFLLATASVGAAWGQCTGGTSAGAITPTAVFQTVAINSGTYRTFAATAGVTYLFSFCQGGGSAGFDGQLTMLNNAGAFAAGYSDDVCGAAPELSWNCPLTGTYRILFNDYFCLSSGLGATMAYRSFVPGPGATCSNPHIVPSLPFVATGLSTCGAGNDYTSLDACNSFYMDGEDYVFRYVATGPQTVRITLSNTLSFTGVFVVQGCPNTGGTCIAATGGGGCASFGVPNESSSGNPVADFTLPGAGTYFFIVDTWPSPACTGFDIDVRTVVVGGGGPGCTSYAITTPAYSPDNYNSGTAVVFPDDEFSAAIPIPFSFCFMGTNYTSLIISSNAYVSFNAACATLSSSWDTDIIPSPANVNSPEAKNSIMFPWADVDPSVGGSIKYNTYGGSPNRRFVVAFRNVPMFSLTCNSLLYTGEVVMYETTNVIDIYIQNLPNCPSWNAGEAVLGLFDASGTAAVPIPGFNNTVYTLSNFARRLTPSCPACLIVLPVNYESFAGSALNDHNLISWKTSHELHSTSFTLERSRDGQAFETVGTVQGAGNEPMGKSYTMEDRGRFAPLTYYRLTHRDDNGQETQSEVITVSSTANGFAIMNAITKDAHLQLDLHATEAGQLAKIEVLDVIGKVVHDQLTVLSAGSNRLQIDLGAMSKGVYFVRATDRQGNQQTRKFVWN